MPDVDIQELHRKIDGLRRKASRRDQRHRDVKDVRAGDIDTLMPGAFPEAWPKPIVANVIDITARDLAEITAPLPSINCSNSLQTSQRSKNFTAKRTKIANNYVVHSELKTQMMRAADWYYMYGAAYFVVEPDFEDKIPRIRIDNPCKTYPEFDLWGRILSYTKVYREEPQELARKFPEHARRILGEDPESAKGKLELVKYCDKDKYVLYMPERQNLVLQSMNNPFGKVPVTAAIRPSYDDQERGQFDDVIWVHLARARMALLGLQASNKAVNAPLSVPTDVQKISFGPDAIIRSNNPEKIRHVANDISPHAFQQEQLMAAEIQRGARTPSVRSGEIDASIVTGKGVQALMSGFDTQVKQAQTVLGRAIEKALMLCFEMDEKFWPNTKKNIRGHSQGVPFDEDYTPKKDIDGTHFVEVSYGFASGLDPSRALVFMLQLRGDQLVSRDYVQRQLPMDLDVAQQQVQIDNEQTTDALKQGVYAMLQSVGIMAQQGQDPTEILYKAAKLIEMREKGKSMADAIIETFAPKPEKPAPGSPEEMMQAGGGPGEGLPEGMQASGLPSGVAPGQAGMGAGGRPDLQTLMAGLGASGRPTLQANVKRAIPA